MDQFAMTLGYGFLAVWGAIGILGFAIWALDKVIRQAGLVLDFAYWYADRLKRKKKGHSA